MYYFIVNPNAGGKRGRFIFEEVRSYLDANGVSYAVAFAKHKMHAADLAGEAESGNLSEVWERQKASFSAQASTLNHKTEISENKNVIVVGGDGTIHEVINGFQNIDSINLGIIPAGTGNDYALPIGIPKDPISAFKLIEKGVTKKVDLMDVSGKRVVCFATSGLDISLVQGVNSLKKKRPTSYLKMLIKELIRDKTYSFKVTTDGKTETFDAFFVGFTTNGVIASGMKLCPVAKTDDGLLDFVIIKKLPRRFFPRLVFNLYKGNILERKNVVHMTGTDIEVVPLSLDAIDLDGELYFEHPMHAKILKSALNLFL